MAKEMFFCVMDLLYSPWRQIFVRMKDSQALEMNSTSFTKRIIGVLFSKDMVTQELISTENPGYGNINLLSLWGSNKEMRDRKSTM